LLSLYYSTLSPVQYRSYGSVIECPSKLLWYFSITYHKHCSISCKPSWILWLTSPSISPWFGKMGPMYCNIQARIKSKIVLKRKIVPNNCRHNRQSSKLNHQALKKIYKWHSSSTLTIHHLFTFSSIKQVNALCHQLWR